MASLHEAILQAKTSTQIIAGLFSYYKSKRPGFSLGFVCSRAGIPSRGYLLDVVKGRRILHPKYAQNIADTFKLGGGYRAYFLLLLKQDQTDKPEELALIESELRGMRKVLRVLKDSIPSHWADPYFAIEVFCALSLLKNSSTKENLVNYFGVHRESEITTVLKQLTDRGLVTQKGTIFRPLVPHIVFENSKDGKAHFRFLNAALDSAKENVTRWFKDKELSHFESSIVSVKKKDFMQALTVFKSQCRHFQTEIESDDAEMLIKFNTQVFPAGRSNE